MKLVHKNDVEISLFKDEKVWGDGQHPSTKYMMDLICKYGVEGKTVIDIGTGSGILSILCGKLGASHILALDIDTHSVECARKNFEHNDVDVETEVNNLTEGITDQFDVIVANLPEHIQIENMKTVSKNMNDGALLIISWWNKLCFKDHSEGFEIIEHIKGVDDYDAYILKVKENV